MIDWNSSALWGIGGFLISLFFFHMGKKRKILSYKIQSTKLITEQISEIPNLEILYNNIKINNLTATNIEIKNVGNDVVEEDNFASLSPLKLQIDEGEIFSSYCVTDLTNKNINVSLDKDNCDIFIHFEFIKPKSSFSILIYHTGNLTLSGELKFGQVISEENRLKFNTSVLAIIAILAGLTGCIISLFTITSIF